MHNEHIIKSTKEREEEKMRYNLTRIMKKAHEIKAENKLNVWSECLKIAWNIAKVSTSLEMYEDEFLPTRKQIGVIYRAFKEGKVRIGEDRISDIYNELDEFERNKMNCGFEYAKANAGGLKWISRAINAIFDRNYEAATIILA